MLIDFKNLPITKPITGVFHIGAHECEERDAYIANFNLGDENIIWIDALLEKVWLMKQRNHSIQIFNECISDVDDQTISFMVTNNCQSSSMLNFKTHAVQHPHVVETGRITMKTKTIQTFYAENSIDCTKYNFMNLDIQGAELLALKGAGDVLNHVDYIYCEINVDELYENCALVGEIDEYLAKYNFERTVTLMTPHGWGDAFYVKTAIL